MKLLVLTALLSTACGDGLGAPASQSSTLTASDAGLPTQDGGTSTTQACDCSGMALPDICMVCSDGQNACAHFVCNAGMCQVQVCQ
jgi:hypothetical protein